jgi:hypothetical protein
MPPEVLPMLERIAVHEAGHAITAANFQANVLGIAFTLETTGFRAIAFYQTPPPSSVDDLCVIYAAGSAGEELVYGDYTPEGATGDVKDIARVGGTLEYDALVARARVILNDRRAHFDRVTMLLCEQLRSNRELKLKKLPNGMKGAFILAADDLSSISME